MSRVGGQNAPKDQRDAARFADGIDDISGRIERLQDAIGVNVLNRVDDLQPWPVQPHVAMVAVRIGGYRVIVGSVGVSIVGGTTMASREVIECLPPRLRDKGPARL